MFSTLNENGGIISCITTNIKMLIDNCIFFSCLINSKNGGAIYFYCISNSDIIIEKCCSNYCHTGLNVNNINEGGQFAYILSKGLNFFLLNSITNITNNLINRRSPITLQNGNQYINSINISNTNLWGVPGITFYSCLTNNMTFSTFNKLNSTGYGSIYTFIGNYLLNNNNIVNNKCSSIIFPNEYSNFFLKFSIIQNNIGIFCYLKNSNIEIFNCWINHLYELGINISINNILTNTFNFNYFSTIYCLNFQNYSLQKKFKFKLLLLFQFFFFN